MGRACAIIENECVDLAELLVRLLVLLSQSLEVGLPQNRQDIIEDLYGHLAPWHSVYIAFSRPALERLTHEPTVFIEWGATIPELTARIRDAFKGTAVG
eukprot:11459920-Alexandrium_andersonii.AAC.1